jgi:predicted secreted protein
MKANNTTLFNNVDNATYCSITTDQTITVKFNNTSMPGIVITSSESPKRWTRAEHGLKISNIYITNAS